MKIQFLTAFLTVLSSETKKVASLEYTQSGLPMKIEIKFNTITFVAGLKPI